MAYISSGSAVRAPVFTAGVKVAGGGAPCAWPTPQGPPCSRPFPRLVSSPQGWMVERAKTYATVLAHGVHDGAA
ncbi:hypothetical protein CHLRE_21g752747v5 [Chlamydomonas reinhardtii]|uniref:Uncharacterized protein n=1 Tax=Chlamydomonas reinhardtii TaxID=3055 RepID=A0A2K3CNA9_CHLRE|nr:uncharacterized protein CHLRE_21g752747v5 [Chlamydomonas reinhardtii]PNW69763.1 hypothetical protein CHLRE_21g752747v5 [Chlamydomonas reinhardtii]